MNLQEALLHRRSYYFIGNQSPVPDEEIERLLQLAVRHVPSAFNSQSSRLVLLLGEQHMRLWDMVKETLRSIVPAAAFGRTEEKIDGSFRSGHGTVLFFEDRSVVESLQKTFPAYASQFPVWSQQTSAMHQLAVWILLEEAGLGASLQHYNPLIDDQARAAWNLPVVWELVAQMPFGLPLQEPGAKEFAPIEERLLVFK